VLDAADLDAAPLVHLPPPLPLLRKAR